MDEAGEWCRRHAGRLASGDPEPLCAVQLVVNVQFSFHDEQSEQGEWKMENCIGLD